MTRTVRCAMAGCVAFDQVPDLDWQQQVPIIGRWLADHKTEAHADVEGDLPHEVEPDPMRFE
jgi:hypothetical protein